QTRALPICLSQEPGRTVEPEDVARLAALQAWAHQRLGEIGLAAICPAHGSAFDDKRHCVRAEDLVWNNDDLGLHNCVAAVRRLGYEETRSGKVFRQAEVLRYMYEGGGAEPVPGSDASPVPALRTRASRQGQPRRTRTTTA